MPGIPFLEQVLPQQAFAFILIFARLGTMLMTFPGVGEGFVSPNFRLGLGLSLAFMLTPLLGAKLPAMPADIGSLFLLIGLESVIGLAIGVAARLLISCMNVTGNIIAMQTGLGFAIAVDPTQGAQGAIVATFLVTLAILMLYITGGHAVLFDGLMRSYVLFPPGIVPPVGDFLELVVRFVSSSFLLGVELAAPFLFAGLVFNAGLALVAKMMPQFQVFFIAMPASILGGFGMLMLLLGVMMTIFLDRFRDAFSGLVN